MIRLALAAALFLGQFIGAIPAQAFDHGFAAVGTLNATFLNAVAAGNVVSANARTAYNNITDGYFYFDGTVSASTTIGRMATTYTGGSGPTVSYAITGDVNGCYKMSGANLQTASVTGSCAPGSAAESITITASAPIYSNTPSVSVVAYAGQVRYLSPTGADTNACTSGSPCLSPNHTGHCGDIWIAQAATTYNGNNFTSGNWGANSCPGNDNLALVKCATFDACKFSTDGSPADMVISASYWGVIGFQSSNLSGSCFLATPPTAGTNVGSPPTNTATIHHIMFADDVVNGCGGDGFGSSEYNGATGPASVDYELLIGNLEYGAGQQNNECYSGASIASPGNSDTVATTHIYVAWSIGWNNIDNSTCNGTTTTDGEMFILDTTCQQSFVGFALAEHNWAIGTGSNGIEVFCNGTPAAQTDIQSFTIRYNTIAYNLADPNKLGSSGDVIYGSTDFTSAQIGSTAQGYNIGTVEYNILALAQPTCCQGASPYSMGESYINTTGTEDLNWISVFGGTRDIINYNTGYNCTSGSNVPSPGGGNFNTTSCNDNVINTDPVFVGTAYFTGSISSTTLTTSAASGAAIAVGMLVGGSGVRPGTYITAGSGTSWTVSGAAQTVGSESMLGAPIPGAPSCGSAANTLACMASTTAAFVSTATGTQVGGGSMNSTSYGAQVPTVCDGLNSTAFINNASRYLPAIMDPCG
jgi:hypothetical protein